MHITAQKPEQAVNNLATSITHYPFGPVAGFTYGNGVVDTRTYDLAYRLTSVVDGSPAISSLSYGYDADDNVHTVTDAVTTANNQTLNYDVIDRLANATGSYGATGAITYDSNSNRKTYGTTSYTVPATSDRVSQAGSTAIGYTGTGNVSSIGTTATLTYNKANQLATNAVSGTTSTYGYDAFGQRLKATVGSTASVFAFDQAGLPLNEITAGTETDYARLDGIPLYAIQPGTSTLSAVHTDRLGTLQKATNAFKAVGW